MPRGPYDPPPANPTTPAVFLYAWSGNDNPGPRCKDAVVVVDATPESPTFGQILNVAFTPTWGNEPHHVRAQGQGGRHKEAGHAHAAGAAPFASRLAACSAALPPR